LNRIEHAFVATVPRGLPDLLVRELQSMGAHDLRERAASVEFTGPLEAGYRACLWSRTASRVLLRLSQFEAATADEFYRQAYAFDWKVHVDAARTLACEFTGSHPSITHSHYGALRLKDAICDRLRDDTGMRPDIELSRPAARAHAHALGTRISLLLDLAGEGLHRRGYRLAAGEAPMRENLAAGVLLRAHWDEAAARAAEFLDPMCGSGTLVIEAAMIAAGRAPGLQRDYFGFLGWKGHDAVLWKRLRDQARLDIAPQLPGVLRGSDIDPRAVAAANDNAARAGVERLVKFEQRELADVRPSSDRGGLICTNPPYGERLADEAQARAVYAQLGQVLREHFAGWDAAILTTSSQTARELRLRSYRSHELWNGSLAARLLRIDLDRPGASDPEERARRQVAIAASPGAQMFANRLGKNLKRLSRLAGRAGVSCFRLYDADMPEYSFAIDRYAEAVSGAVHLYVQEYAAPASIDVQAARRRRHEVLSSLPLVMQLPPEQIHLRLRRRQRGSDQYQRRSGATARAEPAPRLTVEEGGLKFLVNLDDYLDTGLFLDHRLTRAQLRQQARGARFLNLFCYTASATVYAASGGASGSLSLDLSSRYLQWAEDNLRLNGIDRSRHRLERADCLEWLRASGQHTERFDLIFVDPPTFSNSKRMRGVLDVQRDHAELIAGCMRLLAAGGVVVFSTNAQRFLLDPELSQRCSIRDISAQTLAFDFERNPRIHRCFEIRAPSV
jgi:23S rRNA (guanine2445-N2)-methyltransferase / 23S rRNA (guanine2069-N7)-methyltransferase